MTPSTPPAPPPSSRLLVAPDDLLDTVHDLLAEGLRLALICAPEPTRAVHLLLGPHRRVELTVPLDGALPGLAGVCPAALPFERALAESGVAVGAPADPRPLRRHAGAAHPFHTADGDGVHEIPVGPVHAGMIGPGQFRFSVLGESILHLDARLGWSHRGVEAAFRGRRAQDAVGLAERVSGDTGVGHALAFCLAVEQARGLPTSPRIRRDRAVLLECERLHNHVADLGALCLDAGHAVLDAAAKRVREELLRLLDETTGHRLGWGALGPASATLRSLPDPARLDALAADVAGIVELALGHTVVRDRFTGTAVLPRERARALGALGYVAKASGVLVDARVDHPFLDPDLRTAPPAPPRTDGDVLSRFLVRAAEFAGSVAEIASLVAASPSEVPDEPGHAPGEGVGIVEGWRGTIVHRVELAGDGTLAHVAVVDPSVLTWPALPAALDDTIVGDFPLANMSFDMSYAGHDL